MKERTVKVRVRPKRLTRAERKRIKRSQKAKAELVLCKQAIEFHKAYLAIELGHEEVKYEELQARIAQLQEIPVEELVETEETVEVFEPFEESFDEVEENEEPAQTTEPDIAE